MLQKNTYWKIIGYRPIISKPHSITKFQLVEIKIHVFERNDCKPIWCALFTGQVHGSPCLQFGNMAFASSSSSLSPFIILSFRVAYTSRSTSASSGVSWDCVSFLLTSEARILIDAEYSASVLSDGFMSPRPPLRTGNAGRSRSASEQLRLMSDGIAYPRLHALKAAVDSQDPVVFS